MSKTRQRSSVKMDGTSFALFASCLYGSRGKRTKRNEINLDHFRQSNLIPLSSKNLVLCLQRKFDMVERNLGPRNLEHFRISEEGILFFSDSFLIRDRGKEGYIHITERQF